MSVWCASALLLRDRERVCVCECIYNLNTVVVANLIFWQKLALPRFRESSPDPGWNIGRRGGLGVDVGRLIAIVLVFASECWLMLRHTHMRMSICIYYYYIWT